MDNVIFRRATEEELPCILAMQREVFGGEQGIPIDEIDTFTEKDPVCWCAVSETDGTLCAATAAWEEDGETHWGRFVVLPYARGKHIGTELARTSFEDLFAMGVETVCMVARDAAIKIVCGMGGRITGEPYAFYKGNVTPAVLEKKHYVRKG